jgi:hypothetical protein
MWDDEDQIDYDSYWNGVEDEIDWDEDW